MTAATFRRLALSLPEVTEREHMDHPDFRVGGKIFATLGYPGDEFGMVKLTPEEQHSFMQEEPEVFTPCNGAWGRRGATHVRLAQANQKTVKRALKAAWTNVAPKRLSPRASL
jgi:hypothetical protein